MANMTYRELAEKISKMTEEQKDCNISVFLTNEEEFLPCLCMEFADEEKQSTLDHGHPVLIVSY